MDTIVKGCDWGVRITVATLPGQTAEEVIAALTGAMVAATLRHSGASITTPSASIESAASRTVLVTLSAAQTTALSAQQGYTLDLRLTTAGGLIYPIRVTGQVAVVSTA